MESYLVGAGSCICKAHSYQLLAASGSKAWRVKYTLALHKVVAIIEMQGPLAELGHAEGFARSQVQLYLLLAQEYLFAAVAACFVQVERSVFGQAFSNSSRVCQLYYASATWLHCWYLRSLWCLRVVQHVSPVKSRDCFVFQ